MFLSRNVVSVNTDTPKFLQLSSYIDIPRLTTIQKYVVQQIIENGLTRNQIISKVEVAFAKRLSCEALSTCIRRCAYSVPWDPGQTGGKMPYLCREDFEELSNEIREQCRTNTAFDINGVIEAAYRIKKHRQTKVITALNLLRAEKFRTAETEKEDLIEPPSRSWVCNILDQVNAKTAFPVFIDQKRFLACTPDVIIDYFSKFYTLYSMTPTELFFTADESMIDSSVVKKVVLLLSSLK